MINSSGNILLKAFDQRWEDYRSQVKTCRREFSEAAVHDVRVAARRFLAVLDIFRMLDPQPRVQKVRELLKQQLDDLDELRDVQVMLVHIDESAQRLPELGLFQQHLQRREKRLLRSARKQLAAFTPSSLRPRVRKIQGSFGRRPRDPEFSSRLLDAVDAAYSRVVQADAQVHAHQLASIHHMRIAFKKFRYMAEIAEPLLRGVPEGYLKQMHEYQGTMGEVRDVEVFLSALGDFAEEAAPGLDLKPIRHSYRKRQAEYVATFLESKPQLNAFWRAAPTQLFPWESDPHAVQSPRRGRRSKRSRSAPAGKPTTAQHSGSGDDALARTNVESAKAAQSSGLVMPVPTSQIRGSKLGDKYDPYEGKLIIGDHLAPGSACWSPVEAPRCAVRPAPDRMRIPRS